MDNDTPWKNFPYSYPDSFQVILNSLDTASILNCRMVCITWRNWFNTSKTVWSRVLPKVVIRAISRRVKLELEQVWEIRLDLFLDMMDECWTEKQEMSMAIRIERAAKQKLWREFEHTLMVVNQLHQEFARGPMTSPCVGPASIFLRCKVANHKVLSVVGETLARHLNCVFIDEKDKGVDAVRQCSGGLFRAMIGSHQAPRWIFKDFELGWLDIDEDIDGDESEVPLSRDGSEVREEASEPVLFGWFNLFKNYFSPVYNLLAFLWSWVFTKEVKYDIDTEDNQAAPQAENEDDLYSIAPLPSHPIFPSVLELLDCDSPWLKKFLVDKAGIDKILVVPRFEDATSHLENIDSKYTLAGVDETGSVCHLQCGSIEEYEGAFVGDVEYPASNFNGEGYKVHFWGGRDIRDRWPLFARDLALSSQEDVEEEEGLYEFLGEELDNDFYESYKEETDTSSSCTDGSDQAQESDFSAEREDLVNENNVNVQSSLSVIVDQNGVYMIRRSEGGKLANDTDDVSDELQTSDLAISPDLSDCVDDSSEGGQEVDDHQARNEDSEEEEGTNVISSFEKEQSGDEARQDVIEEVAENSDNDLENVNVEEETGNGENELKNYVFDEALNSFPELEIESGGMEEQTKTREN